MSEKEQQLERLREAVDRKSEEAERASHAQAPTGGPPPDEQGGDEESLYEAGRPQHVASVREKNTGERKKTADKWNQ